MKKVISSNIDSIGYSDNTLVILFLNGYHYEYYNVEEIVYNKLISAPSKGKFLNQYIKAKYRYKRLR